MWWIVRPGKPVIRGRNWCSIPFLCQAIIPYKTFKTDKQGKGSSAGHERESLWMHARAGKDEFMQVAYWSRRVLPTVNDSKKKVDRMDLFTDRALYRKGQTVYVSGVAYTQEGDRVEVRKDVAIWLALRDANNREIARKELTTDDFGAFSAEFQLPSKHWPACSV